MNKITQPLIVGVDGSPASDCALRFACHEAAARRLPLAIVHAWQQFPAYASGAMMGPGPVTPSPAEMEQLGRGVLDSAGIIADGYGDSVSYEGYLVNDAPAAALISASEQALLVVVGGRDRARHEPGWLGPVPLRLAARSQCPVIVVPSEANLTGTVVVGVDGSAISADALAFAFHQASRRDCTLTVVFAFEVAGRMGGLDTSLFASRRGNAERQLGEALAGWGEKFPDVVVTQVVTDEPAVRALRSASATASLVVVGSHGRGFFLRHVIGSVSSALLRTSDCPVAVVGPEAGEAVSDLS
jgi:nucleotide-binding universal stress UspA family protein